MTWILLMKLMDAFKRWHERRATIRRLSQLNDHLLRDIGIHRHEIEALVQQSVRSMPVSYKAHGVVVTLSDGSLMDQSCRAVPERA